MNGLRPGKISLVLFFILWLTYGYFYQGGGHNENVRIDLTRALIENGSTIIDPFVINTADCIQHEGHYYSGKAPGSSLLLVPAWWIFSKIIFAFMEHSSQAYSWICYLSIWNTLGLLSALAGVALFNVLRTIVPTAHALLLLAAYSLGTIVFPFSTLFFGHQIVAALLFIGFALIYFKSESALANLVSGLCFGFAVVTEYPAALALIALVPYAFWKADSLKATSSFTLGGLCSGLILILYNLAAFKDPLFISYAAYARDSQTAFTQHAQGILGVTLPKIEVLYSILFGAQRGLFACNPVLLLILPGMLTPLASKFRAELLASLVILLLFIGLNAGYGTSIMYAGGGASVGPRHVIPALPFAMLLIAPLMRFSMARIFALLFTPISIIIMLMATATDPRLGYEYTNPIFQFLIPNYLIGRFAHVSSPTFGETLLTHNSVAFNWGKIAGLPGVYELVPLVLVWCIAWYFLVTCREASAQSRYFSWGLIGSFLMMLAAAAPALSYHFDRARHGAGTGIHGVVYRDNPWNRCDRFLNQLQPANTIQIDARNFQNLAVWSEGPPPYAAPFTIQWIGLFRTVRGGEYEFQLTSDDGACLYIDRVLVIEDWGPHGRQSETAQIELSSGEHQIALRYRNTIGDGALRLDWGLRGEELQAMASDSFILR